MRFCFSLLQLLSVTIAGFIFIFSNFSAAFHVVGPRRSPCASSPLFANLNSEEDGIGIGIDLGTTFSAVAVLDNGVPKIVPVPGNGRIMPSVIHLADDGQTLVGNEAIEKEVDYPLATYRNVKRVIGSGAFTAGQVADVVPNLNTVKDGRSKWKKQKNDRVARIKQAIENPAKLLSPPDEQTGTRNLISPEDLSAHVVSKLKQTVEHATKKVVNRAVVGIPAYFHSQQEEATIRACQLAGIDKVKLLREPEAAALAYGIGREQIGQGEKDELVLVVDLGGGTYDVSILLVGGGLTEVIATSGNVVLGGSDFDLEIAKHWSKLLKTHGTEENLMRTSAADSMVRAAEAARIQLSNNRKILVALPLDSYEWEHMQDPNDVILPVTETWDGYDTIDGVSNSTHVVYQFDRKTMEKVCEEQLTKLTRPLREVAIMAGALLPGDARPRMVQAAIEMEEQLERALNEGKPGAQIDFDDFYSEEELHLASDAVVARKEELDGIDPDILIQLNKIDLKDRKKKQQQGRRKARSIAKDERKYREQKSKITSKASGKVIDGIHGRPISQVVFVGGATKMPAIGRLMAVVTGVVPKRTVNPDEAVALGCAVQVGLLDGDASLEHLTVLTPMQAAVLRAIAEEEGLLDKSAIDEEGYPKQVSSIQMNEHRQLGGSIEILSDEDLEGRELDEDGFPIDSGITKALEAFGEIQYTEEVVDDVEDEWQEDEDELQGRSEVMEALSLDEEMQLDELLEADEMNM